MLDVNVQELGDAGVRALFDGVAEVAKPHLRGVELAIVPASNNFGQAAVRGEPIPGTDPQQFNTAVPFYEK